MHLCKTLHTVVCGISSSELVLYTDFCGLQTEDLHTHATAPSLTGKPVPSLMQMQINDNHAQTECTLCACFPYFLWNSH
jgi:hypothetical protein